MPLRVVFDTSCFHGQAFDRLADSPMRSLCRRGTMVAIYGDVVLNEVLHAYSNESRRQPLVERWLPFMEETAGEIRRGRDCVWHSELVEGRGVQARVNMSPNERAQLFQQLQSLPLDGTWGVWSSAQAELAEVSERLRGMHELRKTIRAEARDLSEAEGIRLHGQGDVAFAAVYSTALDDFGRKVILSRLSAANPASVAARWSRAKQSYPYFTAWVRGMLYALYHPAVYQNARIDRNAQADIEVLMPLHDADLVVSNDTRFFTDAFKALWLSRGRAMMSVDVFVRFLQKLV